MAVDAYCTQASYLLHIAPLFLALPPAARGRIYVELNANELAAQAAILGVAGYIAPHRPPASPPDHPVLIAGGSDLIAGAQGRPVVFLEHGAGQTYGPGVGGPCYSGGPGREAVKLFLVPNFEVAARNYNLYPQAVYDVVGNLSIDPNAARLPRPLDGPVVAFTFHWDGSAVAPEAGTGWHYWGGAALAVAARRPSIGHAHPKIAGQLLPWWQKYGVQSTPYRADVFATADVLVAENTSMLYEWAALDRPVVVLDCPQYRRDVEFGLRFWEQADVGVRIDDLADLDAAIDVAIADPPEVAARRRAIVEYVFPYVGAEATGRAVNAIREVFGPLG